jgi:hypothetical protein
MDDDDDERDAVKLAGKMQQELERRDTRPVGVKMMLGAAFMMLLLVVGAVPIKTDAIPSTLLKSAAWTYTGETEGPDNWAKLDPAFATGGTWPARSPASVDWLARSLSLSGCLLGVRTDSGEQQTPINFEVPLKEAKLPAIGWKAFSTSSEPVKHD